MFFTIFCLLSHFKRKPYDAFSIKSAFITLHSMLLSLIMYPWVFGSTYSRIDQKNLWKTAFKRFFLVHTWIPWPICLSTITVKDIVTLLKMFPQHLYIRNMVQILKSEEITGHSKRMHHLGLILKTTSEPFRSKVQVGIPFDIFCRID